MPDRSYSEFLLALNQSNKGLLDSVNDKMDAQSKQMRVLAKDTSLQFSNINTQLSSISVKIALNEQSASNFAEIAKDLPARMAANETMLANVIEDTAQQWSHITTVKDGLRELVANPISELEGLNSFWTSDNGSKLLHIILLVATGLIGLAGYQAIQ